MFLFIALAFVLGAVCGQLPERRRKLVRIGLACAAVFSIFATSANACDTVVQRERVIYRQQQPAAVVIQEVVNDCPVQRERVIIRERSTYGQEAVILPQTAGYRYQRSEVILPQTAHYGHQRAAVILPQNAGYGREAIVLRQRQVYQAPVVLELNAGHPQRQGLLDRLRGNNRRGQTEIIRERSVQRFSSY